MMNREAEILQPNHNHERLNLHIDSPNVSRMWIKTVHIIQDRHDAELALECGSGWRIDSNIYNLNNTFQCSDFAYITTCAALRRGIIYLLPAICTSTNAPGYHKWDHAVLANLKTCLTRSFPSCDIRCVGFLLQGAHSSQLISLSCLELSSPVYAGWHFTCPRRDIDSRSVRLHPNHPL